MSMTDFYYTYNGRLVSDVSLVPPDAKIEKHYRLRGGKGGFGSMLRAIGNQIEKTTNREMCRDLSGRRMRDVNAEQNLKEWFAKASDREKEKAEKYLERRKRRQEVLEKGPLPDHKFEDVDYQRKKFKISEELQEAVDFALQNTIKDLKRSRVNETVMPGHSSHKKSLLWIEKIDSETLSSDESSISSTEGESKLLPQAIGESTVTDYDPVEIEPTNVCNNEKNDKVSSRSEVIGAPDAAQSKATSPVEPTAVSLSAEELSAAQSVATLERYSLEILKQSLVVRGLKCGGTLKERAARLYSVRHLTSDQYPERLKARASK